MSLPVCGTGYLNWAPYSSPVPLPQHVKQKLFSGECETVNDCSTEVPANTAELTKCATCAKKYTNLDRYYGCTWCQEILAPLAASGRALTWTEVQTYINQTKEQRATVKDKWDALSQCEKGKWVRSTCLANDSQTFPYSSAATGSSTNGSSLSTGAIVGIVLGVVAGLGIIAWVFWYSKLKDAWNEYVFARRISRSVREDAAREEKVYAEQKRVNDKLLRNRSGAIAKYTSYIQPLLLHYHELTRQRDNLQQENEKSNNNKPLPEDVAALTQLQADLTKVSDQLFHLLASYSHLSAEMFYDTSSDKYIEHDEFLPENTEKCQRHPMLDFRMQKLVLPPNYFKGLTSA